MGGVFVGGVAVEFLEQQAGGENIVAHRGEAHIGIAGHGGRVGRLLVEAGDAAVVAALDDAELLGFLFLGTGMAAIVICARFISWNSIMSRMFMR